MEPPSVPVSHYKSGVTRSARDNGPARPIKRRRLLPRVKGKKPSTSHSLTLWLGKAERAKAASRFPRLIHPPSHKVSIVYSSPESTQITLSNSRGGHHLISTFYRKSAAATLTKNKERWENLTSWVKGKFNIIHHCVGPQAFHVF